MRETRSVLRFVAGVLAGVALVLACNDDSPGQVDAGMCDCPAAEPPISGRVVIVNTAKIIAGGSSGGDSAVCPQGAQLLTGSCTTPDINPLRDVTLQQSGFYESVTAVAWHCEIKNNEATPVTIKVSAVCLMPGS